MIDTDRDPPDFYTSVVAPNGYDLAIARAIAEHFGVSEETALALMEALDDAIATPHCEIDLPTAWYAVRIGEADGMPEVRSRKTGHVWLNLKKLMSPDRIDPVLVAYEIATDGISPEILVLRIVWSLYNGSKVTLPAHQSAVFSLLHRKAGLPCTTRDAHERIVADYAALCGKMLDFGQFQKTLDQFAEMKLVRIDRDILSIPDQVTWDT